MTTYPPGPISRYGRQLFEQAIDPQITVVSPEGDHIFYLSGPLAPMPGSQTGVVLSKSIKGLHPIFNHLDYKGARQDGVSWADTVYDPAEIDMEIEFSGRNASELRAVVRDWFASWDPKKQCTLSWFTPEAGEWWCKPRLFKAPANPLNKSPGRHRRLPLDWTMRNDDAFWRSTDSVSSFRVLQSSSSDDFTRADASNLGEDWTQHYDTPSGAGALGVKNNTAFWYAGGSTANVCRCVHDTESESDYQVISITTSNFYQYPADGSTHIDILGRIGDGGDSYIRLKVQLTTATISAVVDGVEVWSKSQQLFDLPAPSVTWTLIVGTSSTTPRQYRVLRNGWEILTASDPGVSEMGADYRGWGFAIGAGAGSPQALPLQTIDAWDAGDNTTVTKAGFLPLTNRGTEIVTPRYLCYGPGTFYIGNGSGSIGSANMVSFGPLYPGQIAMIDTDSRKRGVIDLSPGQVPGPAAPQQTFLNALMSLATSGNFGPLLQAFQSVFGIVPAQGPLYSKLNGRFSRPIAGHLDGTPLVTEQIAVRIEGGNADSKIVGAITPLRRWPE